MVKLEAQVIRALRHGELKRGFTALLQQHNVWSKFIIVLIIITVIIIKWVREPDSRCAQPRAEVVITWQRKLPQKPASGLQIFSQSPVLNSKCTKYKIVKAKYRCTCDVYNIDHQILQIKFAEIVPVRSNVGQQRWKSCKCLISWRQRFGCNQFSTPTSTQCNVAST